MCFCAVLFEEKTRKRDIEPVFVEGGLVFRRMPSRFVLLFLRHARLCLEVPEIGKGSPVWLTPPPRSPFLS